MKIDQKLSIAMRYWQLGGEITIQGKTYVWLQNEIVKETDEQVYSIDGLALKGISYKHASDEEGTVTYLGQSDMPLHYFMKLIEAISDRQYEEILADLALTSFRQGKRMRQ